MNGLTDFVRVPDDRLDAAIAWQVRDIVARQRALEVAFEDQKRAFDAAVKAGYASGSRSLAQAWRFDARMPNTVSDQLSPPEQDEAGRWVRWLVGTSALSISLTLEPNRQYDLTVIVPKFASEVAYRTLFVRTNNQDLPWLTWNGAMRTTVISQGSGGNLDLVLAVADSDGSDSPFAISLIDLKIR